MQEDHDDALFNIAVCYQDMGQNEYALNYLRRVIRLNPNSVESYRMMTLIKKFSAGDPDISQMTDLHQTNLSKRDRVKICFALAKVFEDLGLFKKAFGFLEEGNAILKELLGYEGGQDKQLFSMIKKSSRNIEKCAIENFKHGETPIPIFIIGMPRSGTTLVEQIISSHSQVMGGGELKDIIFYGISILTGKTSCSEKKLVEFRNLYLDKITSIANENLYITDKMPQNFLGICLICSAFPEAKIIHVKRDPAATCWSNFRNYFPDDLGYSCSLQDVVNYYNSR